MPTGLHSRWRRYAETMLLLLGGAYRPGAHTAWAYDLLLLPTFHPPGSITVAQDGDETLLIVAQLDDSAQHQAAIQILLGSSDYRPSVGGAARHDEIVLVDAERRDRFCAEIAPLRPFALDDIDLAARDGLGLRCDCFAAAQRHTIWMHSPTLDDSPRHGQLVACILALATESCNDANLLSYLRALQRYL